MKKHLIVIGIVVILLVVGLCGCNEISNTLNPVKNKFVGDWDGGAIKISMFSDGTVKYKDGKKKISTTGTWELKDDILYFDFKYMSSISWKYIFSNNDRTLTLTVTATGQRIEFTKQ